MISNLRRNDTALDWLGRAGLSEQTIKAIGLGVKEPYERSDGTLVSGVLVYPIAARAGRTRYGCINVAGLTTNPEHPIGWSAGVAEAVVYGDGDIALICASALEAWAAWQAATAAGVKITALVSTQPGEMPSRWRRRGAWSGWSRVIATDGVSPALGRMVAETCGRPIERCPSAPTPSTARSVSPDDLANWLLQIISEERSLSRDLAADDLLPGDFAAERISIHGGLHDGRMYYAFAVERRQRADRGDQFRFSYRTLVIRSDGEVLEPGLLPSPPGTPADRRVYALNDGTRIAPVATLPAHGSWSLPAIRRFAERKRAGRPYDGPSAGDLRVDLVAHLKAAVWLPDANTYGRIASFVMASYFHRLFAAFPILHIQGPKGSGKSELTSTLVSLSFNGTLMSQGSGAALVRLARDCGGLVAIDDAEMLSAGFGELAQVLKTGYKASTAIKRIVASSGAVETVDYFGPRIICNTRGLDHVLSSRCIVVATAPLPADANLVSDLDSDAAQWRDEMHSFAMSHIREVAAMIEEVRSPLSGRDVEIELPIRVMQRICEL